MAGPPLVSSIVSMHLRLRQNPVVIVGDISRMFHQVKVREEDKDYLRLLFKFPEDKDHVRIYRANTIQFGCIDSPMICMYILQSHCQKHIDDPRVSTDIKKAARLILDHSYVDDIAIPLNTPEEAIDVKKAIDMLLQKASFSAKKWVTNSSKVLATIQPEDRASYIEKKQGPMSEKTKVLGLEWDPETDVYSIELLPEAQINTTADTKRTILALSAKVNFDPLGITQPFVLLGRIILQDCFRHKLSWDEKVPNEIQQAWDTWKRSAKDLDKIKLPRHTPTKDGEIHVFGDASGYAFGTVAYLRYKVDNKYDTCFLMSRSRAAPLKMKLTIPNLEMSAAYEAAKLAHLLRTEYNFPSNKIFCYTDSTCVYHWCRKPVGMLTPFVGNRVKKIHELDLTFYYINTSHNPADISSKGARPIYLATSVLWNKGPDHLRQPRKSWPKLTPPPTDNVEGIELGLRKQASPQYCLHTISNSQLDTEDILDNAPSLDSLINSTHIISSMKNKTALSLPKRNKIILYWIKRIQQAHYQDTYKALLNKLECPSSSPVLSLHPFLDTNEVMRVGGRLVNSEQLSYDEKHPILLPKNSNFTKLLLQSIHKQFAHPNTDWMFTYLRRKYWIPKGRNIINKTVKACVRCARTNAKPKHQLMADLPKERTNFTQVWDTLGLDVAGPIILKPSYLPRSKTRVKGYILVFSDLTSRCMHLEVLHDISTASIVKAIKRCGARKGYPRKIISDRMSSFIRANKELKAMIDQDNQRLVKECSKLNIEFKWQFVPPYTPHQAGITERVVYQVKHCIRKTVRNATMTPIELYQLCCDIEAHLNSRPLYKPTYDLEAEDVLTPIHLLLGRPLLPWPTDFEENINMTYSMRERWDQRKALLKSFLKKWHEQYLPTLQSRQKWKTTKPNLKEGTFVLVKDPGVGSLKKQYMWPMGIITKVITGRDDRVRTVEIKTERGIETRAAIHCYPIECFDEDPRYRESALPNKEEREALERKSRPQVMPEPE